MSTVVAARKANTLASGSGRRLARAACTRASSAREVAQTGCEFDTLSAGPLRVQTFNLRH